MATKKNKNSRRVFVLTICIVGLLILFSLVFLLKSKISEELKTSIPKIFQIKKTSFAKFNNNFHGLIQDLKITEQTLPSGLEKITESTLPKLGMKEVSEKIIQNIKKDRQEKTEKLELATSEPCVNLDGVTELPLYEISEVHTSFNFLICYAKSGLHAVSSSDKNGDNIPDYVLDIASEAEKAYRYMKELENAGLTIPLPVKDGRYEILLFDLGEYAGTVASGYREDAGKTLIFLDNDLNSDFAKFITHALIHVAVNKTCQCGSPNYAVPTYVGMDFYNLFQTSSWLGVNASYVTPRFSEPWRHLEDDGNPIAGIQDVTPGSFLFYQYLAEKTSKGNDIIPTIYRLQRENGSTLLTAIDRFLSENGMTWEQSLSEYHVWNLLTGPYALISNEGYDFAKKIWTIYGSVKPSRIHQSFPVTGRRSPNEPRGTGAEYIKFVTKDIKEKSDLEVTIQPGADVSLVVSIVGVKKDFTIETSYQGLVTFPQIFTTKNAQDYLHIYYVIANPSKDPLNVGTYIYEASLGQEGVFQTDVQRSSFLQNAIGSTFTNIKNADLAVKKFKSKTEQEDLFDKAVMYLIENLDSTTMGNLIQKIKELVEQYKESIKKCEIVSGFNEGCFYTDENFKLFTAEIIDPLISGLDEAFVVVTESTNKEEDMKKVLADIEDIKNKYLAINGKIGFEVTESFRKNAENLLREIRNDDPSTLTLEKALRTTYDKADTEFKKLGKTSCESWNPPTNSYCFYAQLRNALFWSIDMSVGYDTESGFTQGFIQYLYPAFNELTIASQLLDTVKMTIGDDGLQYPDASVDAFVKTYRDALYSFKNGYDKLVTTFNVLSTASGGDSFFTEMKDARNLLVNDEYRSFWGEGDWTNEKNAFASFIPVLEEILKNRLVISQESLNAYTAFKVALEAIKNAQNLEELENALAALVAVDKKLLIDYFYQLPDKNGTEKLLNALKTFNSAIL